MNQDATRRAVIAAMAAGAGLASLPRGAFAADKKFKIALSNSYIGNEWRIEMVNLFKAALEMEPYKS
jgi:ribose transport system substrate-binding protein